MIQAFIVDVATGVTCSTVAATDASQFAGVLLLPGQQVLIYDGAQDITTMETFLEDGEIMVRPRPVDTAGILDAAKADAKRAALARRDAAEWGGCMSMKGRVDTDAASQRKISGQCMIAIAANFNAQPYLETWTMADNTPADHNADEMIALALAVSQHVTACHQACVAAKALIDACTTVEELAAIDIAADIDWPA